MAVAREEIWAAVDRLVDRAPRTGDLVRHRLEVFAARRFRQTGRPVPPELNAVERHAAITTLAVPAFLERIRAAYDGPLLVLKGPEIAARYPDPVLRPFGDVDLLAEDAEAAHAVLLQAGFREVGDPELYRDIHHLRPLRWGQLPVDVELHTRPKWIEPLAPPTAADLFADVVPAQVGVEGFLALSPARHAVLAAVHSWAHEPLRVLREVLDVALLAAEAPPGEAAAAASEWGVERLFATTIAAAERVLDGGRRPLALRVWAQNLERVRERTVLENHLQRCLSDLWAVPAPLALRRMPSTFVRELTPGAKEGWRRKLARSTLAVRHAARRRSEHDSAAELL